MNIGIYCPLIVDFTAYCEKCGGEFDAFDKSMVVLPTAIGVLHFHQECFKQLVRRATMYTCMYAWLIGEDVHAY